MGDSEPLVPQLVATAQHFLDEDFEDVLPVAEDKGVDGGETAHVGIHVLIDWTLPCIVGRGVQQASGTTEETICIIIYAMEWVHSV